MTVPRAREHAGPAIAARRPPAPPGRRLLTFSLYMCCIRRPAAGPARPPVARRGLVRSARALAAAALLALSGALALPGTAEAEVLVSNIGQTDDSVVNPVGQPQAQQFTTGDNAAGYDLESVEIPVGDYENVVVTVSLYSDSSGDPGSSIFNFRIPPPVSPPTRSTRSRPREHHSGGFEYAVLNRRVGANDRMKAPTNFA